LNAAALLVFSAGLSAQGTAVVTKQAIPTTPQAAQPASPVTSEDITKDLREAAEIIGANYGGTKSVDYNAVFKSSIDSMLHTLDPHSNYFDAKDFEEFKTDQSSRYYGIGATIGEM
jgi:carboxyl-terminal processing protease